MHKLKRLFCSLLYLGLTLIVSSSDTFAQGDKIGPINKSKIYLGAGVGKSFIDTGITNLTGTAKLDEEDFGFKGLIGYQLREHIAIEGFYLNIGEASLSGRTGDTFRSEGTTWQFTANATLVADATTAGLGVVGFFPVRMYKSSAKELFSPFFKLGFHSWEIEYSETGSAGNATLTDDGKDIFWGGGVEFDLDKNIAWRAGYERFKFDGDDDVDFISGSLIYKF